MGNYRFIGSHADFLSDGRPVAPGDVVGDVLPEEEPLHDQGLLIDADMDPQGASTEPLAGEALDQRAKDLDIKGRTTMSADELRQAVADAEANATDKEGDE